VLQTSFTANWDPVNGATGYRLDVATNSGFTTFVTGFNDKDVANITTYGVTGLNEGTTYYYRVRAYNVGGISTSSNVITVTTLISIPTTPTNLTANVISGSQIDLSWTDASNNEDGFKVERKLGTGGTYAIIATLGQNMQSYSNTGLTELTTYYYRVCAYNSAGNSGYSNEANATPPDVTPPTAPTAVQISPSTWTNQNTFNITWTNPSDPSGIIKVWYTIDVVPTVGQAGTGVAITQGQLQIVLPTGTTSGKHHIYIYLEDGTNNKNPNNCADVLVRYDNKAPVIVDNSNIPVVTVDNGIATPQVNVSCSAVDGTGESGVQSFNLQYIRVGDLQPTTSSFNMPFNATSQQIPANTFVTNGKAIGVSYRLVAVDTTGNAISTAWTSIVVQNAPTIVISTPTTLPGASSYASNEIQKAYRMFSVPYDLSDKRPVSFIPTSLGDHAGNGISYYNWRMQRYVNGVRQDYEDFKNDAAAVAPGNGFFLIVRDPQKKVTIGTNKEVLADLMNNTGLSLTNGWNLVGTPLNMDIKFDSLVFSGGTYADRAYYDGAGPVSGWYKTGANVNVMKAWEGLAIKMNGAGTVKFRTLGPQLNVGQKDGIYGKTISAGEPESSINPMNWTVSVDAYRSDIGMRCEGNSFGMAQKASEGGDRYDSYMPPFIGERNVAVYFRNPEGAMMRDIRPLNEEGGIWEMHVKTGDVAAKVKLQFGSVLNLPNTDFEAYVIDLDQKMAHNLKEVSVLDINSGNGERNFRVVVGKKSYVEENNAGIELTPTTMKLYTNYPNPFNPETIIRYTIPNTSASYAVTLKVFNVLGQEIATLVNAQQKSGYYEVRFSVVGGTVFGGVARPLSSGVYFYQITVSDGMQSFRDVKKMVLMK
jgi:hypothetical protein